MRRSPARAGEGVGCLSHVAGDYKLPGQELRHADHHRVRSEHLGGPGRRVHRGDRGRRPRDARSAAARRVLRHRAQPQRADLRRRRRRRCAPRVLALFEAALPRIDLRAHRGEHPRMGAVDVVPFIPIRGASTDDCVALSPRGRRRDRRAIRRSRCTSTRTRPAPRTGATSPTCERDSSRDSPRR